MRKQKKLTPIICENCHLCIGVLPVSLPHKWSLVACEYCMLNVIVPDLVINYYKDRPKNKIYKWKAKNSHDANERRKLFEK